MILKTFIVCLLSLQFLKEDSSTIETRFVRRLKLCSTFNINHVNQFQSWMSLCQITFEFHFFFRLVKIFKKQKRNKPYNLLHMQMTVAWNCRSSAPCKMYPKDLRFVVQVYDDLCILKQCCSLSKNRAWKERNKIVWNSLRKLHKWNQKYSEKLIEFVSDL